MMIILVGESIQKSQQASIVKTATLTMKGLDVDDFSPRIFNRFWEHIENKFDCTGFCSTVYQLTAKDLSDYHSTTSISQFPLQVPMFRYLFSDDKNDNPYRNSYDMISAEKLMKVYKYLFIIVSDYSNELKYNKDHVSKEYIVPLVGIWNTEEMRIKLSHIKINNYII